MVVCWQWLRKSPWGQRIRFLPCITKCPWRHVSFLRHEFDAGFLPGSRRFLHLAFRAPKEAFQEERVKIGWSIIRHRHPLLRCKVLVDGDDLSTARFLLDFQPISRLT
jgi:hypothetical protein